MSECVLIVEDNRVFRKSLYNLLSLKGYTVLTAENGRDALKKINEKPPDVIVSDVSMPYIDGFELLKKVRSKTRTKLTPFILLTARVNLPDKLQGIKLGADAYISKPFEIEELTLNIQRLIEKQKTVNDLLGNDPENKEFQTEDEQFVLRFKQLVSAMASDSKLQIKDIADELFMSTSTLRRKVSSLMKTSPNQYIREYRLKNAQQLIKHQQGTLSQIAHKAGFNSLSYFSTCYTNFYGISPKDEVKS